MTFHRRLSPAVGAESDDIPFNLLLSLFRIKTVIAARGYIEPMRTANPGAADARLRGV